MANFANSFLVASASDIEYLNAVKRVSEDISLSIHSVNFGGMERTLNQLDEDKDLQVIFEKNQRVFSNLTFRFNTNTGPTISLQRLPEGDKHPFDRINCSGNELSEIHQAMFIASVQKHLGTMAVDYIGNLLGPAAKTQFEAREIALTRLEKLAANLLGEMEDSRKKLAAEFEQQESKLKAVYQARTDELEQIYNARKLNQDTRDLDLNTFKQTLDDAAAKDKRRKDFQAIKQKFTDWSTTYTVTQGTKDERNTVFWSLVVLVTVFFFVALGLTISIFWAQDNVYLTVSRATSWILFVSTALYFVRWNNSWFHQLANEEFRLKRMELDLDRANWMIETASEWKEDNKELPIELLNRMSANLFVERTNEEPTEHTAEALARAIANASQIKLGPTGTEVQWGKRDLNRPV